MHKTQGIAAGLLKKQGSGMSCTSLLRHINKEFRDAVHKPSKAKRYGIATGLLEKNKVQGCLSSDLEHKCHSDVICLWPPAFNNGGLTGCVFG